MSYLDPVRLHFAGRFQADPSTVNNDPNHYNNATFQPNYQQPGPGTTNGWWNPDGSGSFRLVDCQVTRVCYADGTTTSNPAMEPVIGLRIADADTRVAGKLVDLDPDQQGVSEIWGLVVRLVNGTEDVFSGPFAVSPFTDIWQRVQGVPGSGPPFLGAVYQSVLDPIVWGDTSWSRFLRELRNAASDGMLSIKFNVDGYAMTRGTPSFTLGRVVGTIGPAYTGEPKRFTIGRHLGNTGQNQSFMTCVVDTTAARITADFGNALPTQTQGGPLMNIGDVALGWIDGQNRFNAIGPVPYLQPGWYPSTAGVQAFDLADNQLQAIASAPIAVTAGGTVLMQENPDGIYARSDEFVVRLYPGDPPVEVTFYGMQYGVLQNGMQIVTSTTTLGSPTNDVPVDDVVKYDASNLVTTNGIATLSLTAGNPQNPRTFLDGQVYGINYLPQTLAEAAQNNTPGVFVNPSDAISLLIWDEFAPTELTWYGSMQPIFTQYGNLYPIMGRIVDLTDYASVVRNKGILSFVFALPVGDPNSMPVTRDLSPGKRSKILEWLENPLEGTAPPPAATETVTFIAAAAAAPAPRRIPAGMTRLVAMKSGAIAFEGEE